MTKWSQQNFQLYELEKIKKKITFPSIEYKFKQAAFIVIVHTLMVYQNLILKFTILHVSTKRKQQAKTALQDAPFSTVTAIPNTCTHRKVYL